MVPLKTIDVAIGIAFLYLLLTFCASAVVEVISNILNWRAFMLHDAIRNMLQKSVLVTVDEIYNNPLVIALCRNNASRSWVDLSEVFGWRPAKGGTPPSYMPAATFSGAILQTLMNRALSWGIVTTLDLSPVGTVNLISGLLNAPIPAGCTCAAKAKDEDTLRSVIETTLASQGSSIQAVRFAVEKWFNDTMDRTSGWYKRRTQSVLLMIGLILAFTCNLSTITVVRWLWQGDAARQAAINVASTFISSNQKANEGKSDEAAENAARKLAENILNVDAQVSALHYPIGWHRSWWQIWSGLTSGQISFSRIFEYIFGALITAIAISMGSTFWFDALQSLVKIRGAGPKPGSR